MDFCQTFVIGASWVRHELIRFWGQNVKGQGHIIELCDITFTAEPVSGRWLGVKTAFVLDAMFFGVVVDINHVTVTESFLTAHSSVLLVSLCHCSMLQTHSWSTALASNVSQHCQGMWCISGTCLHYRELVVIIDCQGYNGDGFMVAWTIRCTLYAALWYR